MNELFLFQDRSMELGVRSYTAKSRRACLPAGRRKGSLGKKSQDFVNLSEREAP